MLRRLAGVHRAPAGLVLAGALILGLTLWGVTPHASAVPAAPSLAFITGTSTSPEQVWVANAQGAEARQLGEGSQALLAPDGMSVAASLEGARGETGPAFAVYPTTAGAAALTYLDRTKVSVQPLAWSPNSRYLAVALYPSNAKPREAALDVLDTSNGALAVVAHGNVYGASFAPDGTNRIAYGLAHGESLNAAVNLYVASPIGGGTTQVTHDGRSLYPLWGPSAVVYDREHLRGRDAAPEYQLWLKSSGGSSRRLTKVHVGPLVSGLVPIAFSADGSRLLAEFEGQDTSDAWSVSIASHTARRLRAGRRALEGAGISRDGSSVLVDVNGLFNPPSTGSVATLPFGGGRLHVIVPHGSQASWTE
jgi:hypothetical protein